jgi:hypothetical protein
MADLDKVLRGSNKENGREENINGTRKVGTCRLFESCLEEMDFVGS